MLGYDVAEPAEHAVKRGRDNDQDRTATRAGVKVHVAVAGTRGVFVSTAALKK